MEFEGPVQELAEREGSTWTDGYEAWEHNSKKAEKLIDELKGLVSLKPNQSIPIHKSSETTKILYEMYFMMKQHDATGGVYSTDLLKQTDQPLIKIKKIKK